jgi:DNA polymerase III subunit gamma/tau
MASYQSFYRRYRPQRFDEVLGQDHVTKALRNAVRDGRVGHAYLFSGPRGTGKTSTARILAKVLNCAAPVDGEPCGHCENCVAVAEGRVVDWLLEQDAASKSKVDDMRDLLERVPLGTSGNRKVIILDEVHMLSQGAENALLKTLEEPPDHVVFVLATTDPQKVRPTIRSRTQHFAFRLLPPDVIDPLVRHVIVDAGLRLDDEDIDAAVEHVVHSGGGSARDTLSALDQVAALGGVIDEAEPVDAVVDALCDHDPGRVLVAVADALASGRDPRTLGENVIAALRDAFLAVMGAADDHLPPAARERAARVGERLGPAGLTRALDILGEALTELSKKPDPRIVVEVALVRLTQPSTDRTLDAVVERLDRLERDIAGTGGPGGAGSPSAAAPAGEVSAPADEQTARSARSAGSTERAGATGSAGSTEPAGATGSAGSTEPARATGSAGSTRSVGSEGSGGGRSSRAAGGGPGATAARDALSSARGGAAPSSGGRGRSSGKPTLGSVSRGRRGAGPPDTTNAAAPSSGRAAATVEPGSATATATADAASSAPPALSELVAAWSGGVLDGLPVKIRSKWRAGRWIESDGGALRFAVPNSWHRQACDEARTRVEQALAGHFGHPVAVAVVVDGDPPAGAGEAEFGAGSAMRGAPPGDDHDHEPVDPSELRDAAVATAGVDLLLREFGGELVEEDQ